MTTDVKYFWYKPHNSRIRHAFECHDVIIETTKVTETRRYWRCVCGATGWTPRR